MKTKIIQQNKNPFLEREEFMIEIVADSTPTVIEISEDLGKDKDLTIVRKINTNFGVNKFVADVIVYDTKEAKDKNLVLPQKVRKKMEEDRKAKEEEEKKKKEEEAKAAAEAEKAAEEAKEEVAEETKEEPAEEAKEKAKEATE